MPPIVMVLVFGALGVVALWAIGRDLKSGLTGDSMYRFQADRSPFWFAFVIVAKIAAVLLCAAIVLEALGYSAPMAMIRSVVGG